MRKNIMTLISQVLGRIAELPPAETDNVVMERDLRVPMPDGVSLLADHYSPHGREKAPLILVRCPYGRSRFFGLLMGRFYAERGFQVVIQKTDSFSVLSCARSSPGSGEPWPQPPNS
jgi:predicted acyl esterase